MPQYAYKAKTPDGEHKKGTIEAESEAAVIQRLRHSGLQPLDITVTGGGLNREINLGFGGRVTTKTLAIFTRQFATMQTNGLPMSRTLALLCEQTQNKTLIKALRAVRTDVESNGMALSAAMAKHDKVFPDQMVKMIGAGEVNGSLDNALTQIANNYEAEVRLVSKIRAAVTYPIIVLFVALMMVTGMLLFIVPKFQGMFASLGGHLPAPTMILLAISKGIRTGGPVLILALIVAAFAWKKYNRLPAVRNVVDPLKLRLPVFGPLFRKVAMARLARNLSTSMEAGVPILQAIDIVSGTVGSIVVARAMTEVKEAIREGQDMSAPMANNKVFPKMMTQMLSIGEETGTPDQMLRKVAMYYDQEVETTTESLTALLEPLMIVGLGLMVGAVAMALYMPMVKIFDLVG